MISALTGKKILIVDDYIVNCELFSLLVSDTGGVPLIALNGRECINQIKKNHVDLILMDSKMPVMNGVDATREIRSIPEGKDLIIIGITVSEDEKDRADCLDAGMNQLVGKLTLNHEKLIEIGNKYFVTDSYQNADTITLENDDSNCINDVHNISDSDEHAEFNYEKALKEFENDKELVKSLILDFISILYNQLTEMRSALRKNDITFIQNEAHGIKGGAANICALQLSKSAATLELACKQHTDILVISEHLNILATTIDNFKKAAIEKI